MLFGFPLFLGEHTAALTPLVIDTTTTTPTLLKPTAPTLRASYFTYSYSSPKYIKLTWDDNSSNETGFEIWRKSVTNDEDFTCVKSVSKNTEEYTDKNIQNFNNYWYYVRAVGSSSSLYSDSGTVSYAFSCQKPVLTVEQTTGSSGSPICNLSWTDPSDNEMGFFIERTDMSTNDSDTLTTLGANQTTYTDEGPVPGRTYKYVIEIYRTVFCVYSEDVTVALPQTLAAKPMSLVLTAGAGSVQISWADKSNNEDNFYLYRKTSGSGYTKIATLAADETMYTDTGLASSTTYYYKVTAYNAVGESSGAEGSATTLAASESVTAPDAPSDLDAVEKSDSKIKLTWTDQSDDEEGFEIWRESDDDAYAKVGSAAANAESYSDTGLDADNKYTYYIRAYNDAGENDSDEASATTMTAEEAAALSEEIVMQFYIGNTEYYVNDEDAAMDVAPVIQNGRTLLPIKYVADEFGSRRRLEQ